MKTAVELCEEQTMLIALLEKRFINGASAAQKRKGLFGARRRSP
jgi:hypothetical protein